MTGSAGRLKLIDIESLRCSGSRPPESSWLRLAVLAMIIWLVDTRRRCLRREEPAVIHVMIGECHCPGPVLAVLLVTPVAAHEAAAEQAELASGRLGSVHAVNGGGIRYLNEAG